MKKDKEEEKDLEGEEEPLKRKKKTKEKPSAESRAREKEERILKLEEEEEIKPVASKKEVKEKVKEEVSLPASLKVKGSKEKGRIFVLQKEARDRGKLLVSLLQSDLSERGDIPIKKEPQRSNEILKGLLNLLRQLKKEDPSSNTTAWLEETIIDLQKAHSEYDSEIEQAKGDDEKEMAEAKLMRRTAEELKLLADQAKVQSGIIPAFLNIFSDITGPSTDQTVTNYLKNTIAPKYFDQIEDDQRDAFRNNLVDGFALVQMNGAVREGQIYQKLNPMRGLVVMTSFIRKSHLGDEAKGEVKPQYFYTGEVEPQSDAEGVTLDYILAAFGAGIFEAYTNLGPLPFAKQSIVQGNLSGWSLSDAATTADIGLSKTGVIPTKEQLVTSVEDAKKAKEKNCGYVFTGSINGTQVKEVYLVDADKNLKASFWDEKNQKDMDAYKGYWLSDPYQVVYVVAPADNSRLNETDVNQRKIAFYNLDAAKKFAELANAHPYWYDQTKGWNLKGWSEKMTGQDFAVMAIEDVLRNYLTPGVFTDFESYYSNTQPFTDLPIYEELKELNSLVHQLQAGEIKAFEDIETTFKKIEQSMQEKNLPHEGYGLKAALNKTLEYIQKKFDLKPPSEEHVMKF